MFSIQTAKTTPEKVLKSIETFEEFCLGKRSYTPATFREINEELSISTVLILGKYRFHRATDGQHLIWRSLNAEEYDLGPVHKTNVMRDFPGFHRKHSMCLYNGNIKETQIVPHPNGKGNLSIVIMKDGTIGIGPNHRIALRNAALRIHLASRFNFTSLLHIWDVVWGRA